MTPGASYRVRFTRQAEKDIAKLAESCAPSARTSCATVRRSIPAPVSP